MDWKKKVKCLIKQINLIAKEIEDSGLFSKPTVIRILWNQNYTADEFFGFALTGNQFVQRSLQLAKKHNGIIERPLLCVLYLTSKL